MTRAALGTERPDGGVPAAPGRVVELDRLRIERAIGRRHRYRYVRPRIEREGAGWKIVSANCSRHIDPAGGEIDIAWLVPAPDGHWLLHARDHAGRSWRVEATCPTLADALRLVCLDAQRVFWP